jgi:oligo-1,6-glucosidase
MRGTSFYYNGDELGMTNAGFTKIEDYRDMPTLNEYQNQKNKGGDLDKFIKRIAFECRDNGRTPFQWDAGKNAGFSTGAPWLKVNPNHTTINAYAQEIDANSCLNYFRKVVGLRKNNKALVYGKYSLLDKSNPKVYAYTRELKDQKLLILLNFSDTNAQTETGLNVSGATLILSNYKEAPVLPGKKGTVHLRPYEAIIYKL